MKDSVQEIKSRLDIVEVVGEYVNLTPAGSNYKALSPFRSERTPSFMVSSELQIFKDFGGDKAGDIFTFIMEMEGVDFREALKILADRAGVELSDAQYSKGSKGASGDHKKRVMECLSASSRFYQAILEHPEHGKPAREYLESRGIHQEMIKSFGIGFAPQHFTALTKGLAKRSFTEQEMQDSGMGLPGKRGGVYDRFRGRIMIPIKDTLGRVIAFTGRILPEYDDKKMGKYINSPQTMVFDKSSVLFGLDIAKLSVKQAERVIVVEGQMDVIMSHQAGVTETVAVSGTALTDKHVKTLMRYAKTICLAFDNDEAGLNACKRSARLILSMGGVVKVIPIQSGKDTADMVREDPQDWVDLVSRPIEFLEFYVQSVVAKVDPEDVVGKQAAIKESVEFIQDIQDPIQKSHYVRKLSSLLGISEQGIYDTIKSSPNERSQRPSRSARLTRARAPRMTPSIKLQRMVLGYVLFNPENRDILGLEEYIFTQTVLRSIFTKIIEYLSGHDFHATYTDIRPLLTEEELRAFEEIYFEAEQSIQDNSLDKAAISQALSEAIALLKSTFRRQVRKTLRRKLAEARTAGNHDQVQEILQKIQQLTHDN